MRCKANKLFLAKMVGFGIIILLCEWAAVSLVNSTRNANKTRSMPVPKAATSKAVDDKKMKISVLRKVDAKQVNDDAALYGSELQKKDASKDVISKVSENMKSVQVDGNKGLDVTANRKSEQSNGKPVSNTGTANNITTSMTKQIDGKSKTTKTVTQTQIDKGVKELNHKTDTVDNKSEGTKMLSANISNKSESKGTGSTQANHTNKADKDKDTSKSQQVSIPGPEVLLNMDILQLEEFYFRYIETIQKHCNRERPIGDTKSGSHSICEDVIGNGSCLVYSFSTGVRNETPFDKTMSTQYGCVVHSFYSTYTKTEAKLPPSSKLTFRLVKLGVTDDPKYNVLTLGSILKMNQHAKIDILKMDIDYKEWDSLAQIAKGQELGTVKLLIVEFHVCDRNCSEGNQRTKEQYARYLSLFKQLYDIGFRIYFVRSKHACSFKVNGVTRSACHDVYLMNIALK